MVWRRISKYLKGWSNNPLVSVRRQDGDGDTGGDGAFATRPGEVDEILRRSWGAVYAGNYAERHTTILISPALSHLRLAHQFHQLCRNNLLSRDCLAWHNADIR